MEPSGSTLEALLAAAHQARRRAYAPYSRAPVGAVAQAANGSIYVGVNIENVSYGLTICAERNALAAAVAAGARDIVAVAIAADSPARPCGACRQVIWELAPGAVVIWEDEVGRPQTRLIRDLLPEAYAGPGGV